MNKEGSGTDGSGDALAGEKVKRKRDDSCARFNVKTEVNIKQVKVEMKVRLWSRIGSRSRAKNQRQTGQAQTDGETRSQRDGESRTEGG